MSLGAIRELESSGRWQDLIRMSDAIGESLRGEELGRAYGALSTAYYVTAQDAEDMRRSLEYAYECLRLSRKDTPQWLWSLQKVASILIDLGLHKRAEVYATMFLSSDKCGGSPYTPYVIRSLSHIAYRRKQYRKAAVLLKKALHLFRLSGNGRECARTAVSLAWALMKAGKLSESIKVLPEDVDADQRYLLDGIRAQIAFRQGDMAQAESHARNALLCTIRCGYDNIDAADAALLLSRISHLNRDELSERRYLTTTWRHLQLQGQTASSLVGELECTEGGVYHTQASSRCGSAGHKRTGLLGSVG